MENIKFTSSHRQLRKSQNGGVWLDQIVDDRLDIANPSIENLSIIKDHILPIECVRADSKEKKGQAPAQKLLDVDVENQTVIVLSYEGGKKQHIHSIPFQDLNWVWVCGKNAEKLLNLLI